jgi:hypothetical protein
VAWAARRPEAHHLHSQTKQKTKTATKITTIVKFSSNKTEGKILNRKQILASENHQESGWMNTGCQKSANDVENAQVAWLQVIVASAHPATAQGHTKYVGSAGVATF